MEISTALKPEKSQAELEITVPAEDFQPFLNRSAKKLSAQQAIKGFRPGKAPVHVVAEHFGQERLLREAMEAALPHFFVKAAVEEKIEAINQPSVTIKQLGIDKPFQFLAIVDVLPQVKLGNPQDVKVQKRMVTVEDAQIEQELRYLAKMRSTYLDVARPAQKDDVVTVDFEVRIDGQIIEGGASKNHPVTLGDSHFVPDFEKGITGINTGEKRSFTMKFPPDYPKKELRGKDANVSVAAQAVQKRVVPSINDDFARQLGKFKDLNDLKGKLKDNMSKELEYKEHDRYLGELAEKFAALTNFGPIPEVLIEKEIDNRVTEFTRMLAVQQKSLDEYLRIERKTLQEMRADMRPSAEKNIRIGLTLRALAEKQQVEVSEQEVEQEAAKQLQRYKKVAQAEKDIDVEELHDHVAAAIRNRKTLEKLAELASSNERRAVWTADG